MDEIELKQKLYDKEMEIEYLREKLRSLSQEFDEVYRSKYAVQQVIKIRKDDIQEVLNIDRVENRPEGMTIIVR